MTVLSDVWGHSDPRAGYPTGNLRIPSQFGIVI